MPQSIWEAREEEHPPPEWVTNRTDEWAYIGGRTDSFTPEYGGVWTRNAANTANVKAPVRNQLTNAWTMLNDVYRPVDYTVEADYNKLTITTLPAYRDDITEYWIQVSTNAGMTALIYDSKQPYSEPYNVAVVTSGITALTQYWINVRSEFQLAEEPEGPDTGVPEWSANSIQTITTPNNPIPTPPINLRSPNRGNTWIDLAWDHSANGQAVSYQVFSQVHLGGEIVHRATVPVASPLSVRVGGLGQDTPYQWWVIGIGPTGLNSPPSNVLRWHTGHDGVSRSGSIDDEALKPKEWGSWRKDIAWLDWHGYNTGRRANHNWVYQGYWSGPRNTGPTIANTSQREQDGRYKGLITYDVEGFRARLNARFGYDVAGGFNRGEVTVTRVSIKRPYRQRQPGNLDAQYMRWWLMYGNPHNGGEPALREDHVNNKDDADHKESQKSFKAGTDRNYLRLPRMWGRALVMGTIPGTGTKVNGIGLYRGDNDHNGYGTAGYARFAGHGMHDDQSGYKDNSSDWTILIDATWTIQTVAYVGPFEW